MARGTQKIQDQTARSEQARLKAQQNAVPQLFTTAVKAAKGGGPVVVRFLEQGEDVNVFEQHEYKEPGAQYADRFTCLKESPWNGADCPGCTAGLKVKLRAVYNVIQRNRPVYRRGADGFVLRGPDNQPFIDGHQDQVVLLDVPSTTAEELRKKDGKYHGLMSRDIMLSESGVSYQPWSVEPADIDAGPQQLSANDQALMAQKHNIDAFMKPPTVPEAQAIVARCAGVPTGFQGGASPQGNAGQAGAANGFLAGAPQPAGSAFGAATAPPQITPEGGAVPVIGNQPTTAPAPLPAQGAPQSAPVPQGAPQ